MIHSSGYVEPGSRRDDVVERLRVPVERDLQVHLRRARAEAIGDRQRAAPVGRRDRPVERGEQRLRVAVRDRQHRNLRQRRRVAERRAAWRRASRRRRASADRRDSVGMSITLPRCTPSLGRIGPSGNTSSDDVAVVARIGVDQAADRAVLGGDLRLDAAPRLRRSAR